MKISILKISTILLCLLFSLTITFTNCKRDTLDCSKSKETNNYSISSDDKSTMPYTGTDTLVFISNNNDTDIFNGTGRVISQDCVDGGGSPECPPFTITNCFENISWQFTDIKNNSIFIGLTQNKNITDKKGYTHSCNLVINFLNSNFYFNASDISSTRSNYIQNIGFNGKPYFDVTYAFKDITDTTTRIYLNKTIGIIRIELNNQQLIWTHK